MFNLRNTAIALTVASGLSSCNLSDAQVQELVNASLAVAVASDTSTDRQRSLANSATEAYLRGNRRSSDRALEQKLQRMVNQIAAANDLGSQWTVYLIDNDQPNALTPGGGVVMVHDSFLEIATSEAQMAMILAHEMAHSTQAHAVQKQRDLTLANVVVTAVGQRADAGLEQTVLGLVANASVSGYSRGKENEADRIGFGYYVNAGYDPFEAADLFRNMSRTFGERDNVTHALHGTHPRNGERAAALESMANRVNGGGTRVTTSEFERLTRKYR